MKEPPIVEGDRIREAIPQKDCSGRIYTEEEREDLLRHMLFAAEIQRDHDIDYCNLKGVK